MCVAAGESSELVNGCLVDILSAIVAPPSTRIAMLADRNSETTDSRHTMAASKLYGCDFWDIIGLDMINILYHKPDGNKY